MPAAISKEVKAFAFGLIKGVGGSPYSPSEITRMVNERFGVKIASKTISNWKSDLPSYMKKYGIDDNYVKEVIDRGLFGAIKPQGDAGEEEGEDEGNLPQAESPGREPPQEINSLPNFGSLAEMVAYMERQGFIVATSDQDLRDILNNNGFTLLKDGALQYGPEIISLEPLQLDFEAVGKQIGGNAVIMWYYGLARKLAELAGEESPELVDYVTSCVVDAMVARKYNMALLIA